MNAHNRRRDAAGDVAPPHRVGGEAGVAGVGQGRYFQQDFFGNGIAGRVQHREVMPRQARLAVKVVWAHGPLPEFLNKRRGKPGNGTGAAVHTHEAAKDAGGTVLVKMQGQKKHVAGGVRVAGGLPGPDLFRKRGPVPQRGGGVTQAQGAARQGQSGIDGPDGGRFGLQERRGKLTAFNRENHLCAFGPKLCSQLVCQPVRQRGFRQWPRRRAGVLPAVSGVQNHGDAAKRLDFGGRNGQGQRRCRVRPQPEPEGQGGAEAK